MVNDSNIAINTSSNTNPYIVPLSRLLFSCNPHVKPLKYVTKNLFCILKYIIIGNCTQNDFSALCPPEHHLCCELFKTANVISDSKSGTHFCGF